MKTTATKRANSNFAGLSVIMENEKSAPSQSNEDRLNNIATAAYYKAEARGFVPGQELDDWLDAEAKFNEIQGR